MTKVSIVTVVYNRRTVIGDAIDNLRSQSHADIEHVVIDGASTDGALEVIRSRVDERPVVRSAPDHGIYDALRKGFRLSSGQIVGILHSDELFADHVVTDVHTFESTGADIVYGDLQYVSQSTPAV